MTNKDAQGNTTMDFPITKKENVEGLEEALANIDVPVKSVNGQTGDVVIPEPNYPVTSVNGMTGAVTVPVPTGISDYIIESYRNGTEWYRKWKSGWVEQGGYVSNAPTTTTEIYIVNFLIPFANKDYVIYGALRTTDTTANITTYRGCSIISESYPPESNLSFKMARHIYAGKYWVAEGQGA